MICRICKQPIEYIGVVDPEGINHGWTHVDFDDGLDHKAAVESLTVELEHDQVANQYRIWQDDSRAPDLTDGRYLLIPLVS